MMFGVDHLERQHHSKHLIQSLKVLVLIVLHSLTEIGFVAVPDLDNATNGYVARGGANENPSNGGNKCLGAVGTSYTGLSAASAAITNLGAGIVDALFGNGGFCEANPGADDMAMTYRLIGTATYNNFMNSPWTLSPNFAWAHDFRGNGSIFIRWFR